MFKIQIKPNKQYQSIMDVPSLSTMDGVSDQQNNVDTLTSRKVMRTEWESTKEYSLDKPINSHN